MKFEFGHIIKKGNYNMKVGDRFFTIAYTLNTRVIEVEVIEVQNMNDTTYIHFQNVEKPIDRWFKSIDIMEPWIFKTREEAELKL